MSCELRAARYGLGALAVVAFAGVAQADEPELPAEATVATTAATPAAAPVAAVVRHVPPPEAEPGEALRLAAAVANAWTETSLVARYRRARSNDDFVDAPFERSSAGGYWATIPGGAVRRPGLEYYIVGVRRDGQAVAHFASEQWPHEVRVEPTVGLRWMEAEHRRLGGRERRIAFDLVGNSFGDVYGNDYYYRGELGWTQRLVTWLYSFTLGYGFIAGETPDRRSNEPMEVITLEKGLRYGYGETRVRLHRVIWVDLGAILGFSQDGFAGGVRGDLVLGKEWRSCVKVGGEWLGDMGNTYWLELQWDTVVPFLMSARIRATDLPGAVLTGGGGIEYTVKYPVSDRISIGAKAAFNARDRRPGSFGGGLSAAIEF